MQHNKTSLLCVKCCDELLSWLHLYRVTVLVSAELDRSVREGSPLPVE